MNNSTYSRFVVFCILHSAFCISSYAQQKDLGGQEYVIIKDYKPVLAESYKISDTPEGDTTTAVAQKMDYNPEPQKLETNFEAGVIKAVKIKDEPIPKLYPALLKLGIGNNTTYYGELFYNSLRSKTGEFGVHLNHLSGQPQLTNEVNSLNQDASFSNNTAEVYGKYFLDNATLSGNLGFDSRAIHYYGFPSDSIVKSADTRQQFNHLHFALGYKSNFLTKDHLDYEANFAYHTINDLFDVTENDFLLNGGIGKRSSACYAGLNASLDYFEKTKANFENLDLYSNLTRNIITLAPYIIFADPSTKGGAFTSTMGGHGGALKLGLIFSLEQNLGNTAHLYPDITATIPIAEHVVYIFGDVTGNLQKVNYRTLTDENPFTTSAVKIYENQSNNIILDGGVKGNFSSQVSFDAMLKYNKFSNMPLFYNDTTHYANNELQPNKFNILYDGGFVLDLHAELSYRNSEKLMIGLTFDQYSYTMDIQQKAWHKPANETKLWAKYNLQDKIIINAAFFFRGMQYAPQFKNNTVTPQSIDGYADINLGAEYRYSKVLSFYAKLNNLGFAKYYQWYNYPSERFNVLGGLTYAF
jgi:hypothetical protein